jgi:two-component system chemotaxis response regulator CheB
VNRDLVAIGASAGGIEALKRLATDLPADLPAAILVVVHMAPNSEFYLPQILSRLGPLEVVAAEDGLEIKHGRIILARPGFHLLVRDGHVHLGTGPRENRSKPAIDPLFRSVAATYRGRAIGVVFSGWLNDGTSGLYAIKRCGGVAVAQDPMDALAPEMPRSAIVHAGVDHIAPIDGMAELLSRLTRETAGPDMPVPPEVKVEADIAFHGGQSINQTATLGDRSVLACAECGGGLTEICEGETVRFRCHTGHAFTADSLLAEQGEAVERALLSALKTLEERAAMWKRMADRNEDGGNRRSALRMKEKADISKTEAELIRMLLDSRREHATVDG